jgi:putative colanic acid biosynthesis acetyltransferase WcaF
MRRWNILLLRLFGAKIANTAIVYSSARIFMPEHLEMDDHSCLAGHTIIENAAIVHLKEESIVSQYSYLCTASHDIRNDDFPQFSKPIIIGKKAWVTAGCFVGPGVTIGDGAVVGARSAVFKDVKANTVVGGNPAQFIKNRYE